MSDIKPQPSFPIAIALVLFVMRDGGEVVTVGGDMDRAAGVVPAPWPGCDLQRLVFDTASAVLPPRTVSSRFHPLMPRMHRSGSIVLPFWATGRLPADGAWMRPLETRALERLAEELGDPGIVTEANGEFRRALATDLLSHKMVQEPLRVQALASEEARRLQRDSEVPSIVALLPEEFTIEQLRAAVAESVRLRPDEAESSSNFRRRIEELVSLRVLEPAPYREESKAKGRPAQLYSFNARAWRVWLERLGGKEPSRAQRPARRPATQDFVPTAEMRFSLESPPRFIGDALRGGGQGAASHASPRNPQSPVPRVPAPERPADSSRVDELESMVRLLMRKVERLSDSRSGEPGDADARDDAPSKPS